MKTDVSSIGLAIFCGCMVLGSCIFTSAQMVQNGLNSVASSLDRTASKP